MPQLPAPMATEAAERATGAFTALDPGVYTGRLAKVEATTAKSSGAAMWSVEFDKITDMEGKAKGGRLFTNLVLTDSSMWKVGQFFDAFGVPTSTNTDTLIGHRVRLNVAKRVIQAGSRAGQEGNEINGFVPLAADDAGFAELQKLQAKSGGGAAKPAAAKPAAAAPAADAAPAAEAPSEGGAAPAEAEAVDF